MPSGNMGTFDALGIEVVVWAGNHNIDGVWRSPIPN